MAAEIAPLFENYPEGTPGGFVAGDTICLKMFIPGEPVSADRPRGRVQYRNGTPYVQFYMPKKVETYVDLVATIAHQQAITMPITGEGRTDFKLPLKGRMLIDIRINKPKPKSYSKAIEYPVQKPDVDNYLKTVLDGLVRGHIIADDAPITDERSRKRFATYEHPAGVEIDLTVLPIAY